MASLIWGVTAALAGAVVGLFLRGLPPPGTGANPLAGGAPPLVGRSLGWIGAITLVGVGVTVSPWAPFWLGGVVLAAGYATLAATVAVRCIAGESTRRQAVDRRFEEIVAPLRNEMPT